MTETAIRPQESPARAPDHDRWAAYWQEMHQQSIALIGEAFDDVAKRLDAGDTRAVVEVVMFAATEDKSVHGIAEAVHDLLRTGLTAHAIASDYEAGVAIGNLIGWAR